MRAFAFGPGKGVISFGASIPTLSPAPAPAGSTRRTRSARRSRKKTTKSTQRSAASLPGLPFVNFVFFESFVFPGSLLPFPAGALRAVFEDDAPCRHVVADAVGFGEVAAA